MNTLMSALLALLALPGVAMAAPQFDGEAQLASDTGHILLSWQAEEPVTLLMGSAPDLSDAGPVYAGTASSYFLSGLSNGEYYLQLAGESGERSEPVVLTVVHQSLAQALWLTLIGLVITAGIIGTIWRGTRND